NAEHEAYIAVAWGVRLSHEMMNSWERRLSSWSNATCAMPLCEALPSRRGRRAHHAQMDRVGTWEIPRSAASCWRRRPASGRRGAVADDARAWEVGLCHSSREADEQSGTIRCGAGGAKGGDQGECGPAKHAPGTEPDARVTGAGAHTASSKGKEEGEVHLAPPPHQHRPARCGFLQTQTRSRAGDRWSDVEGL